MKKICINLRATAAKSMAMEIRKMGDVFSTIGTETFWDDFGKTGDRMAFNLDVGVPVMENFEFTWVISTSTILPMKSGSFSTRNLFVKFVMSDVKAPIVRHFGNQNFVHFSLPIFVRFRTTRSNPIIPWSSFHQLRRNALHFRRRSSRSREELIDEQRREFILATQGHRFPPIFFRFRGKAGDNIRHDTNPRNLGSQNVNDFGKFVAGVFPFHIFKYGVGRRIAPARVKTCRPDRDSKSWPFRPNDP